MALFGFRVLLGVVSLLPSPSQYKEVSAVRCRCLDIAQVISEVSEKYVPISLKYCTSWGKMLEVASFSAAVTLQYANACLGLLWGLQDVFPPPPCLLLNRACNTSQPCSTFAGPFASICQRMLASQSLLLRSHDSGPQLRMQDPNLVCATQYTKNVPPLDPMHCSFTCWKKCVVCTLV